MIKLKSQRFFVSVILLLNNNQLIAICVFKNSLNTSQNLQLNSIN